MPVDISSIPLYIKSGAIIPMAENQIYNLMHETVTGLHILMAPDVDSEFTVYDDDGKTNEYQNGAYLKTNIKVTAGVRTCVDFTYEGNYENTVDTMYLDVVHREKRRSMFRLTVWKFRIFFTDANLKRRRPAGITARA